MSSLQPDQAISFKSLGAIVEKLQDTWSSRAAYGSIAAAEVLAPDYRRTAAELALVDPQDLRNQNQEYHRCRNELAGQIDSAFKAADRLLEQTQICLSKATNLESGFQQIQVESFADGLSSFILNMERYNHSSRQAALERPGLLARAESIIEKYSGSAISAEVDKALLGEREAQSQHLTSPEIVEASLQNNLKMIAQMKSILELLGKDVE